MVLVSFQRNLHMHATWSMRWTALWHAPIAIILHTGRKSVNIGPGIE